MLNYLKVEDYERCSWCCRLDYRPLTVIVESPDEVNLYPNMKWDSNIIFFVDVYFADHLYINSGWFHIV